MAILEQTLSVSTLWRDQNRAFSRIARHRIAPNFAPNLLMDSTIAMLSLQHNQAVTTTILQTIAF
jgi:hypothetical protein